MKNWETVQLCKSDVYGAGYKYGVLDFAIRLRSHYPHSNSVLRCIDKVVAELLEGGDK